MPKNLMWSQMVFLYVPCRWFAVYRCCPRSPGKSATSSERSFSKPRTGSCSESGDGAAGCSPSAGPRWGERRVRIFDPAKYGNSVVAAFRACRSFCRTARDDWLRYVAEKSQQRSFCSQESWSHAGWCCGASPSAQKDRASLPERLTEPLQGKSGSGLPETDCWDCRDGHVTVADSSILKNRVTLPASEVRLYRHLESPCRFAGGDVEKSRFMESRTIPCTRGRAGVRNQNVIIVTSVVTEVILCFSASMLSWPLRFGRYPVAVAAKI